VSKCLFESAEVEDHGAVKARELRSFYFCAFGAAKLSTQLPAPRPSNANLSEAPKARYVTAWGNAPGTRVLTMVER